MTPNDIKTKIYSLSKNLCIASNYRDSINKYQVFVIVLCISKLQLLTVFTENKDNNTVLLRKMTAKFTFYLRYDVIQHSVTISNLKDGIL